MTEKNKNILSVDCDFVKDSRSLVELIKFVLQYIDKIEDTHIVISQKHVDIYYILEPLLKNKKTIDVVSIDHHHDLTYPNFPIDKGLASSNWLGYYLMKPNFIDNAYWLSNYTSDPDAGVKCEDWITITKTFDDIAFDSFDYLFICESPSYATNEFSLCAYRILIEIITRLKNKDKFFFMRPTLLNHKYAFIN